ncbi:MAG: hypothetical protein QM772_04600 [Ottowia sp.]|uniref:hypothetical protein n=1 Tax=Ottowia sp. TaxID=1898956 RepID=UPI0039E4C93F
MNGEGASIQPSKPAPDGDITSPNPYPVGSTGGTDPASNDSYAYYNAAGEITIVGRGDTGDRSVLEMLEEVASRTVGATVGTIESFGEAASGAARVAANSFIQVGSILTGDLTHDHPVIQQAWREQQQLGETLVNAMLSPRETTSRVIEAVVNRYDAAMALSDPYEQSRALSHLFNDVGQAALGAGYTAGSLVRPGAALARAVGENAFTGPAAGGRNAQRGGIGSENRGPGVPEVQALAQAADTPLNGVSMLTVAGRATTKHPEYFGFDSAEMLRAVYRTEQDLNLLAQRNIAEILTSGVRTTGAGGRYPSGWVTYTLPDGRAASWHANGDFIGFRGAKK